MNILLALTNLIICMTKNAYSEEPNASLNLHVILARPPSARDAQRTHTISQGARSSSTHRREIKMAATVGETA